MDAREKGFGLVIPLPFTATSQLGNIVYIDDEGIVEPIGNIFKESLDGVSESSLAPCGLALKDSRTTCKHINTSVAITSLGLQGEALTKEECKK
jgi:hypothetical protein